MIPADDLINLDQNIIIGWYSGPVSVTVHLLDLFQNKQNWCNKQAIFLHEVSEIFDMNKSQTKNASQLQNLES